MRLGAGERRGTRRGARARWAGQWHVGTGLLAAVALAVLASARPVPATTLEWQPVADPSYRELELLRASGLVDSASVLFSRPMARGTAAALVARARRLHADSHDPGLVRLEREFGRELVDRGFPPPAGYTPPLLSRGDPEGDGRVRLFAYGDGSVADSAGKTQVAYGSRAGGRLNLEQGSALLHLDAFVGRVRNARLFADPLVAGHDLLGTTEDTYVSVGSRWLEVAFGRSRIAWGPGSTGSLLWSASAEPFTFLEFSKTILGHVRATAVHADVDAATGARIAGHRLEWFPSSTVEVGVAEAVRYSSPTWEPLYVFPLLPFTWVQRLAAQDTLGSGRGGAALRNNVMASIDVSWRARAGNVLYGEFLLDDLALAKGGIPTRLGYQAGWLGTGSVSARRGHWRAEYSRVYNYVYSTFYGESFIHHGRPIGYPVGPDSRNLRVEGTLDMNADWQVSVGATKTDRGAGELGRFYDPALGDASGSRLSGVIETTRSADAGVRFAPRDGMDLSFTLARDWLKNQAHVAGDAHERWRAALGVRLRK